MNFVTVGLADRVGPTVVHAPSTFDDETIEVYVIGFADESLSCDGIVGLYVTSPSFVDVMTIKPGHITLRKLVRQ